MNARFGSWIKQERLGLYLVIAAWALFFGPVYLTGNLFFLDDLKIIYYPLEHAYAEALTNWNLPQWNTSFGFGHPLLAWAQLGFFTPLHVILRVLRIHPLVLLQVSVTGYFLAGLIGMYTFLRKRAFQQLPAALGAALLVFSGFSIGHLNHVNFYTGTMLLPWLLLAGVAILERQTARRAAILALAAAAIALSAQPQVVLFVFLAAAGILLAIASEKKYRQAWRQIILSVLIAGVLGAAMGSLTILPLLEFLPETERASALPRSELLEFSYPPWHAITLLLPYFYGNHEAYWGAKGFQELAAFTGIFPLALAGIALTRWKKFRSERIVGVVFIVFGIAFALGRYSPLYAFLVERLYISSIGVASRFVYFFDIGIMLLAACGLSDVISLGKQHLPKKVIASAITVPTLILAPFAIRVLQHEVERQQLRVLVTQVDPYLVLVAVSGLLLLCLLVFRWHYRPHVIAAASIATLIIYSWNYNPPTPARIAFAESALSTALQSFRTPQGTPPRLYSRPTLLQSATSELDHARYSDPISPKFSVYQPLPVTKPFHCVHVPLEAAPIATADITIGLHTDPLADPIETVVIPKHEAGHGAKQEVCFSYRIADRETIWVSITSPQDSGIAVAFAPQTDPRFQVRFVRTPLPNADQWDRSQKPLQALITPKYDVIYDIEAAADARHMQVLDGASSARWIGALSIREYRAFIEFFFANDASPFDGDGQHVIQTYRNILDMTGITHLAQLLPAGANDYMEDSGFTFIESTDLGNQELRVYHNPSAFPKAFLVPGAIWKAAADETRDAMSQPSFDPQKTVYISGPKPPDEIITPGNVLGEHSLAITRYEQHRVDVDVETDQPAYLVLTDSTTPQWHTYIDGQPAPQLVGNSIFKTAYIPAGSHLVSFQYESVATTTAVRVGGAAFIVCCLALIVPGRFKKSPNHIQ